MFYPPAPSSIYLQVSGTKTWSLGLFSLYLNIQNPNLLHYEKRSYNKGDQGGQLFTKNSHCFLSAIGASLYYCKYNKVISKTISTMCSSIYFEIIVISVDIDQLGGEWFHVAVIGIVALIVGIVLLLGCAGLCDREASFKVIDQLY